MGLVKVDNELYSSLFANFILFFLMNTCDLVKHFGAYLLAGSGQTMENDWLIIIIFFFWFCFSNVTQRNMGVYHFFSSMKILKVECAWPAHRDIHCSCLYCTCSVYKKIQYVNNNYY